MARDYNLPASSWNVDTTELDSSQGAFWLANLWNGLTNTVNGMWNDWTGQTAQAREFEQQEYLQDKMNQYNIPANQMARMRAAGINPNTAASAIAGSGSESAQAPQVSTNTQGVAAGVNAAANLASSLGAGFESTAKGMSDLFKLNPEIKDINAGIKQKLADAGLSESTIRGLDIDNMYKDEEWKKKLRILDLNADNLMQDWKKMQSEYDLNYQLLDKAVKDMEVADSEIGVNTANKGYLEALKTRTDYEAQWMNTRIQFWKDRGFDILASSRDMAIVQMIENGKIEEVNSMLAIIRENEGQLAKVVEDAKNQSKLDYLVPISELEQLYSTHNSPIAFVEQVVKKIGRELNANGYSRNYFAVRKARKNIEALYDNLADNLNHSMSSEKEKRTREVMEELEWVLSLSRSDFVKFLDGDLHRHKNSTN